MDHFFFLVVELSEVGIRMIWIGGETVFLYLTHIICMCFYDLTSFSDGYKIQKSIQGAVVRRYLYIFTTIFV